MPESDPFLRWLAEQEYYIPNRVIRDEWPLAQFRSMAGVTCVHDDDTGELKTPRRDYRQAYVYGSAVGPEEDEAPDP